MRKHPLKSTIALSLALSACSLAPSYQRPQMAVPTGWSSVAGVGVDAQPSTTPFWQELGNADLDRLIEIALAQNLDLEAALHRIEQARGQAKVAASPLYPTVSASGSASRTFQDQKDTNSVRGGGSISYEVDLWGKNRDAAKSADYNVDATQFDREALRLVVTADVTDFYAQILSLNDRIRIAEFNLKNAEEILRIIEARYNAGGVGNPAAAASSLASSLLAPIFTGGRLTGNLQSVTARQKELAAQYQKTVLVAFQEVEDALAALKSNNEQAALSVESVKESQNAYDIAKARFDAGAIDYLTLLETQRSLYQAQDSQIAINQGQLVADVQLRKALGA